MKRIIKDRQTEIEFQTGLFKGFEKSIQDKVNETKKLDGKIDKVNDEIKNIKSEIFGEFCERYGFVNGIEDYENLHGSTLRIRAKERAQYSKAISVLENKLEFERARCKETEERERGVNDMIGNLEEEESELSRQKKVLENKLDIAEAEFEVLKVKLFNLKIKCKIN